MVIRHASFLTYFYEKVNQHFSTFKKPFYTFPICLLAEQQFDAGWRSQPSTKQNGKGFEVMDELVEILGQIILLSS